MKSSKSTIFFIGNLDSNLFQDRIYQILRHSKVKNYKVINTSRKKTIDIFLFILVSIKTLVHCILFSNTKIVFHGAYNSILWILVLITKNFVITILQGSELEKDYTKLRSLFINLILKNSKLIVCRNQEQFSFLQEKMDIKHHNLIIINWGLNKNLFNIVRKKTTKTINIISPRASQSEYNIDIIFDALERLKSKHKNIVFTYVKFNSKIKIKNESIVDKKNISPNQDKLWQELVNSDICISIPIYDGFSNTVLESLALGTYVVLSDIRAYNSFKNKKYLAKFIKLTNEKEVNIKNLYNVLKLTLNDIDFIRRTSNKRRNYIYNNFSNRKNLNVLLDKIVNVHENKQKV